MRDIEAAMLASTIANMNQRMTGVSKGCFSVLFMMYNPVDNSLSNISEYWGFKSFR